MTFAIRHHQTLRFYPDEKFGYEYPESYIRTFGEDYKPEPYLQQNYKGCATTSGTTSRGSSRSMISTPSIRTEGDDRAVHRHHRAPVQAAEGRHRLRQQPGRPHVADDHVPGPATLGSGASGSGL